jgi:hypothetical protein
MVSIATEVHPIERQKTGVDGCGFVAEFGALGRLVDAWEKRPPTVRSFVAWYSWHGWRS